MRKISLVFLIQFVCVGIVFSQGFDPKEMALREKQNLYKLLTDLSEDQTMLIDGVYDEYAQSFVELRDEIRKAGDWQSFRPKIMALRQEKDEIMSDILNEDQFQLYTDQMETNRQNMQKRRKQQQQQQQQPPVN